ncbi:beta strand repeat-containing protein, partial [Flavivirga algicola]
MKKPTILKNGLIVLLILFSIQLFAQNQVPFTTRFDQDLKGDIILIGNNILGPNNNDFNNNNVYNHTRNMRYIDIDSDPTTFSSSSADLEIPINPNIPLAANDCYEIVHAGLYWSAVDDGSEAINTVKLRGPTGGYNDIVADDVIFDAGTTSVDGGDSFPYACYADVTNIIRALGTDQGTYTVANVSSAEGQTDTFDPRNGTGYSAGWSLFIVYQNPSLPGKSITSFDGFSTITRAFNPTVDISVSGFRTVPAPAPVRANFAFAALEGDKPITGDRLRINGTSLSDLDRSQTNFFNSSVTGPPARQPNSSNTLGFDTGILAVPNPSNGVIANDDTSATIRLETSGDTFFPYFFAFAVDIIAPNMVLTKTVEDTSGNNIGGGLVNLGDELNYVIGFQNTGNDDATGLTIRDVLPNNIEFDYPADMGLLPPGVTVQSYNPATRELIFAIDDSVVEENDPVLDIRFKVTVVRECSLLNDACDNIVSNQAFSTYRGTLNPLFVISDDPSFSTNTGCLLIPGATNFIADIDCTFEEDVILCGDNVVLTAGDDYDTYSWSTDPSGTPVIGTTQSITVTSPGTYYVHNTATAPCQSIDQIFNVITYGAGVTNPIIPFADQVVTCPNDGKQLPNIFMCGATDTRFIDTNITDANSIIWERLDETSCPAVGNIDCANEDATCTWNQVQTGPDYLVDTAGQYRLTLNYTGGCFNEFFFNVYENVLVPTATSNDIICTTPGEIVVNDVPSGYEYSIDNTNYQASNTFSITTPGVYTVYIRQVGVTPNPCIFTVPNIQIRERDFTVTTDITHPLCHDGQGTVLIAANDVRPQYYYSIYSGATLINSVGPIVDGDYTFNNLNPGTYTINVSTDDGCTFSGDITINNPPLLTATAALTNPLTFCPADPTDPNDEDDTGEITVYPVGGTAPYFYFVNSTTVFQTVPEIVVTDPGGVYNIRVVDSNNCFVDLSITVDPVLPPDFNITKTDILCASSGDVGEININVTNPNGNTLRYSIDNGATFVNSPVFTGLAAGDYEVIVEYTSGPDVCESEPQTISIIELSPVTGTATLTTPYTCTTNGVITVSGVSGGTAPYTYSINGVTFQAGTIFTGLTDGTYTVTIRDANNCTFVTAPIILGPLDPPTDLTFTDKSFDCSDNTSSFNVNLPSWGGGLPPIRFQIIALPASIPVGSPLYNYLTQLNSDGQYSGVPAGTYTFQVTDRNGCTYQEDYYLEPEPPIEVTGTLLNNVTCFNSSTGAIQFDVIGTFTGGNNVYDYDITGPVNSSDTRQTAPTITLNNVPVGTYDITVTERSTGCTDTASVTVSGPPTGLALTLTPSPVTCNVDGSVVINATGGWGGNTFTLTQPDTTVLGPQGSNTFANLTQTGTYTVAVTDSNGCTATDTFTLSSPTAPSAVIDATSDLCYDAANAATLVVTASGGQTPYEYNINGGPFGTSNTFANLTPGTYTIIVRDAYGCTVTLPAQTIAPQLTVSTVLTKDLDCTASPDALITGTIVGGVAPYTYEVSLNAGAYSPLGATGTPFTYLTATAGDYQFRITDSQNCQAESGVITVNPISNPTATVTSVNATCNGAADGSVQIVPSGGEGPYTYSFNGSAFTATSSYTGLSAGTYAYQVRDNKSCIFNGSVTLTEPTSLAATAAVTTPFSCSAANTSQPGTITVTTTAGTGTAPYQYSFNGSGYSASNTFDVNDNGTDQTINYSVRDAQGCIFNGSIVISALNPPTADSVTGTPVTCNDVTSTVTVTAAAGTGVGALTYEITAPAASATSNATGIFTGLAPDTYTFRVTDADGCYYETTYTVDPVINIVVTGALINDVSCNGGSDGAVDFTVSSFSGTYSYTINAGAAVTGQSATAINLTGLPAGDQVIVVTDEVTGCTDTFTVTVTEPANPLTFTSSSTNVFCSNDESQITVTASDGTPGYRYAAVVTGNPAPAVGAYGSSNIVTVDTNSGADLVWDVYVMDANDCVTMNTVTITSDASPTINPVAQQCYVGSPLNITLVEGTGTAVAPLSYSIGAGYQSSATFSISAPG